MLYSNSILYFCFLRLKTLKILSGLKSGSVCRHVVNITWGYDCIGNIFICSANALYAIYLCILYKIKYQFNYVTVAWLYRGVRWVYIGTTIH